MISMSPKFLIYYVLLLKAEEYERKPQCFCFVSVFSIKKSFQESFTTKGHEQEGYMDAVDLLDLRPLTYSENWKATQT